jgi:hypothetical protein
VARLCVAAAAAVDRAPVYVNSILVALNVGTRIRSMWAEPVVLSWNADAAPELPVQAPADGKDDTCAC